MYRSVRLLIRLVACTALVATAACTSDGEKSPEDPFAPLPKVHHESPKPPADKDADAVMASLRAIDPCALLENVRSDGDEPYTENPYECGVRLPERRGSVVATVGVYLPANSHAGQSDRVTLAGAKAYGDADGVICTVALPVSFERAVTFVVEGPPRRTCMIAKSAAKSAVRAVRRDKVATPGRPLARWDACSLLRRSVKPNGGVARPEPEDAMHQCRTRDWKATLELDYSWTASERGGLKRTVNGTKVFGSHHGQKNCLRAWFAGGGDSTVVVDATSCAIADRITSRAIAALSGPPPKAPSLDGRLLYRPGEPDSAAPGACSDLPAQDRHDCEPYVEAGVPDDPVELIRHAEADPNVNCSMAADAVRKHFGDSLRPVTATFSGPSRECVFVGGSTQVSVRLSREPRGTDPLPETMNYPRELEIAGHLAIGGISPYPPDQLPAERHELFIALDEPDDPGSLFVALTTPESDPDRNPMHRSLQRLDAFATTLVQQHL